MPKPLAILDTCIIDYSVKKHTKISAADLLTTLDKKHSLYISVFTRFEAYRGANSATAALIKRVMVYFDTSPLNKECIDISAALYTCYESEPDIKKRIKNIGDGDFIIGATSFSYNSLIITSNRNDFPYPYFTEVESYNIEYKNGNIRKNIPVSKLRPNYQHFNQAIKLCYPKASA